MTREEILAMIPGRELDELVAEKVMGIMSEDNKVVCDKCKGSGFSGFGTGYDAVCDCTGGYIGLLPHYSTDISASFEVIQAMQQKGWYITIERYLLGVKTIYYRRLLEKSNEEVGIYVTKMGDAEGIVKAALLATEVSL